MHDPYLAEQVKVTKRYKDRHGEVGLEIEQPLLSIRKSERKGMVVVGFCAGDGWSWLHRGLFSRFA